eukprot:393483-Hanusia_phi.AAC.1
MTRTVSATREEPGPKDFMSVYYHSNDYRTPRLGTITGLRLDYRALSLWPETRLPGTESESGRLGVTAELARPG